MLQLSPGYRGRALCSPVQSGRVRSRFYASPLNTRFGNYGARNPLVEPLIYEPSFEEMGWNGSSDTHFSAIDHQNAKSVYPLSSNACNGPKPPDRPTPISGYHGRLHCLARKYLGSPGGRGLPREDHRFVLSRLVSRNARACVHETSSSELVGELEVIKPGSGLVTTVGSCEIDRSLASDTVVRLGSTLRRTSALVTEWSQ